MNDLVLLDRVAVYNLIDTLLFYLQQEYYSTDLTFNDRMSACDKLVLSICSLGGFAYVPEEINADLTSWLNA